VEDLRAWLQGEGPARDGVDAELDAEDLPLLLRAWQLRIGPLRRADGHPLTYRHIAVDEVQDFSPVEVRVLLGCLDEHRSITLAGDTQQHVVEGGGFTSWSDFLDRLGVPGAEVETLRVSYRCSREIAEAAMTVLGDLREEDSPPATVRMISVTSSKISGRVLNSCNTPSNFTAETAEPIIELSSTRRKELPRVTPNPRSNGRT
jgi:superfamily I DNA/RNA helicase